MAGADSIAGASQGREGYPALVSVAAALRCVAVGAALSMRISRVILKTAAQALPAVLA